VTTRAEIVACARSLIGVRWRHQGCSRRGVDCIGLVGLVAAECEITRAWLDPLNPWKGYGRLPQAARIYQACAEFLRPVTPKGAVQPGDLMLLKFEADPQHFAIVSSIDPPYMIHAYTQARRVVENGVNEMWRARWICSYAFAGID
jgi:cell wall-associated NlpC family hydrolase